MNSAASSEVVTTHGDLRHANEGDRTPWAVIVVGALGLLAGGAVFSIMGLSLVDQLRTMLALMVQVLLPGLILSVWLRRQTLFAQLSVAYVCGLPVQLVGWALAVGLQFDAMLWITPVAVALLGGWFVRRRLLANWRHRVVPTTGVAVALLVAWVTVLALIVGRWSRQQTSDGAPIAWYMDLYWHLAINASAMRGIPVTDPQVVTETLTYHWFSNAHVAALALGTGVDLDALSVFVWNVPGIAALLGVVVGFTHYLTRSLRWASVAAFLMVVEPVTLLNPALTWARIPNLVLESPSHMFGTPPTVVCVWAIVVLLKAGTTRRREAWPSIVAVVLLLGGAKVSAIPVLICGTVLALLPVWLLRRRRMEVAALLAFLGVCLGVSSMLFAGGGGGSKLSFMSSQQGTALWKQSSEVLDHFGSRGDLALLVGFAILCLAGLLWAAVGLLAMRVRDVAGWVMLGTIGSAIGVTFVLGHPSYSELYFLRGVQPLLGIAAVVGMAFVMAHGGQARMVVGWAALGALAGLFVGTSSAWSELTLRREAFVLGVAVVGIAGSLLLAHRVGWYRVMAACAAALLAFSLVPGLDRFQGRGLQATLTGKVDVEAAAQGRPADELTRPEAEAAIELRALPAHAVVATNVHCRRNSTDTFCDHRAFWVGGLGRRQLLLGAWPYSNRGRSTQDQGGRHHVLNPYPDKALVELNEALFTGPSETQLTQAKSLGVTHLFADKRASLVADLSSWCERIYENQEVTICGLR